MKPETLAGKHIVLLGVGHTNAHIVRKWAMEPIADADLTCISNYGIATYSGMLPAALAGQIRQPEMEIDLVQLCESVGARLIIDQVTQVDLEKSEVKFAKRPAVPFDALSIGIGSVPTFEGVECEHDAVIQIKPMQSFLERLSAKLATLRERPRVHGVVVGSGIAGIEILLCLGSFLNKSGIVDFQLELVTRSEDILPSLEPSTRHKVKEEILRRGYRITNSAQVTAVRKTRESSMHSIEHSNGKSIEADFVIWATGAASPPKLAEFGLPTNVNGFLPTDHSLKVESTHNVFAVGDTGTIAGANLPKAGVYAVRQGPILWENLQRQLEGKPLISYRPQKKFLKLINYGDGRALAERHGFSFEGKAAYWLKNQIDSKFMEKYRPKKMESGEPMQCRGCGCKLGADELEAAIDFGDTQGPELEDAAPVGGDESRGLLASTDFFSLPFRDAYLNGRVAALHSASDLIATGADVLEALANVVLPDGDSAAQRKMLSDFTAGANQEFKQLGAKIVGGHTIVGPRFEAGFTVIGRRIGSEAMKKDQLCDGDRIYLTKPLGIGVLLAAHMRSECRAQDYASLIDTLLKDQAAYSRLAVQVGVKACTDITGFGLVGHLLEMLNASQLSATLDLDRIPVLPGALDAIDNHIESSLFPENIKSSRFVAASPEIKSSSAYRVLFDPQTSGGLLFGVPQNCETPFISGCEKHSLETPTRIGIVRAPYDPHKPLSVEPCP